MKSEHLQAFEQNVVLAQFVETIANKLDAQQLEVKWLMTDDGPQATIKIHYQQDFNHGDLAKASLEQLGIDIVEEIKQHIKDDNEEPVPHLYKK